MTTAYVFDLDMWCKEIDSNPTMRVWFDQAVTLMEDDPEYKRLLSQLADLACDRAEEIDTDKMRNASIFCLNNSFIMSLTPREAYDRLCGVLCDVILEYTIPESLMVH